MILLALHLVSDIKQINISVVEYEVSAKFELTEVSVTRSKDNTVRAVVDTAKITKSIESLADLRRAKICANTMVRTLSGLPATLGPGSSASLMLTKAWKLLPTYTEDGIKLDATVERAYGPKSVTHEIKTVLKTGKSFTLTVTDADGKRRLVIVTPTLVPDVLF
ncbi:hypothetical protein MCEMSE15_00549 [Fimbriimonadaceae bacterium]